MTSVDFKDSNVKFAEEQDNYITLPALRLNDQNDTIITCWRLSWHERIKCLFTGRIWMSEMNFNRALTPRYFSLNRKDVYSRPTDKERKNESRT